MHCSLRVRLLVEPACGASLAAIYEKMPELDEFNNILVVVCDGATTTTRLSDVQTPIG